MNAMNKKQLQKHNNRPAIGFTLALCFLFSGVHNLAFSNTPTLAPLPPLIEEKSQLSERGDSSPPQKTRLQKAQLDKKAKKSKTGSGLQEIIDFQWLNESQVSLQWAYAFLREIEKQAPDLLKEKISESFKNDLLFYLNFHQNIMQFLYLKWGFRASAGVTRNEDHESLYFIPMSLSLLISLQIFEHQAILPFFEMGYSLWNVDFFESSDFFPFWSVGADISFSLFKKSLRYTLPDEYGIKDIGISLELRNNLSPTSFSEEDRGYFLRSFHAGVYFKF